MLEGRPCRKWLFFSINYYEDIIDNLINQCTCDYVGKELFKSNFIKVQDNTNVTSNQFVTTNSVPHSSNFNNCQGFKNITSNHLSKQNSLPHSSNCNNCQGITNVTSNHIVKRIFSPHSNVSQVDNSNILIPACADYGDNGVNQFSVTDLLMRVSVFIHTMTLRHVSSICSFHCVLMFLRVLTL
jgi:hypothetical protein